MNLKLSNNAVGRLAAPISAGQTSFSLQAGQGAKFPVLGENDYFTLTAVRPDTSLEIMYVTARSFDVLTVLRGQEDTLALDFDALTIVENRITAKSIMGEIGLARSIVNAALQVFQPTVPVGIDQLRLWLLGAIGPDQLASELNSRIALIDGSSAVGGSVNQRVKNATDAFIAALTQEAADRTTYVQQYAFSKQGTNAAISAQASVTRAEFTAYADAARQSAINTSTAYANSYTYSAADIRNAIAASESTLRAEFSGGTGGGPSYATQAYVQNYAYSIAQADGAIAAQTADLRTTVGNNTAAINQSATTLNGLSAQVFTKIDVNGYITGYGLASTGATSAFVVRAERFLFVGPDGTPQPLFSVANINGKASAVLRGSLVIGSGGLTINKDPYFSDIPGMWDSGGSVVIGLGAGGNAPAPTYLGAANGGNVITLSKERIPIDSTKTYILSASIFAEGGSNRQCVLLVDFYDGNGVHIASTGWGDSTYSGFALFTTPTPGNWYPYRGGVFGANAGNGHTIPSSAKTCRIGVSLNTGSGNSSTLMGVTALSLEEQLNGTSIQDDAIKARHVEIDTLQALSNIFVARPGGTGQGIDINALGVFMYDPFNNRTVVLGDDSL